MPQDEIFHFPQTVTYCQNKFGNLFHVSDFGCHTNNCSRSGVWDSKITTFPGLYLFGWLSNQFVLVATANVGTKELVSLACTLSSLRALNSVFTIGCLVRPLSIVVCSVYHFTTCLLNHRLFYARPRCCCTPGSLPPTAPSLP